MSCLRSLAARPALGVCLQRREELLHLLTEGRNGVLRARPSDQESVCALPLARLEALRHPANAGECRRVGAAKSGDMLFTYRPAHVLQYEPCADDSVAGEGWGCQEDGRCGCQDVADLLGVHLTCVSNWENGRGHPHRDGTSRALCLNTGLPYVLQLARITRS